MGNICGSAIPLDSFPPVMSPLAEEDREIVIATWPTIYEERHRIGVHIYHSFLTSEKDLRVHFPKITSSESTAERLCVDQAALLKHALAVMEGLAVAVDCLRDQSRLDAFLGSLGERHYKYGVRCDVLHKLYPAFSTGVAVCLDSAYTRPVKLAYKRFFFYMTCVMKISMIQKELVDRCDSNDLDMPISGCFNKVIPSASGGQHRPSKSEDSSFDISTFKRVVE